MPDSTLLTREDTADALNQGLGFHEIEEVPVVTEDVNFPPPAGFA